MGNLSCPGRVFLSGRFDGEVARRCYCVITSNDKGPLLRSRGNRLAERGERVLAPHARQQ